jgi:hypothetical protein
MQFSIDFYFEVISLLSSIFFYSQKRNKIILYFIPFLLATVFTESIGIIYVSKGKQNYSMYNIFTTLEFLFYTYLFHAYLKTVLFKKFARIFFPAFLILVILNMLFVQGLGNTFNTNTFLVGSFFIVIFCCCYFYEAVLPENIDLQISRQPFFWISSGLLIFYLGSLIINSLFVYLRSNDLQNEGIKIYGFINHSLNVILYSSFCVAFYLCPNNKKISSSASS